MSGSAKYLDTVEFAKPPIGKSMEYTVKFIKTYLAFLHFDEQFKPDEHCRM